MTYLLGLFFCQGFFGGGEEGVWCFRTNLNMVKTKFLKNVTGNNLSSLLLKDLVFFFPLLLYIRQVVHRQFDCFPKIVSDWCLFFCVLLSVLFQRKKIFPLLLPFFS